MKKNIIIIVIVIIVFACGIGYYFFPRTADSNESVCEESDDEIPIFSTDRIVKVEDVKAYLVEIDELSTCKMEYVETDTISKPRKLMDEITLPGTTNTLHVKANVVVKAGFNIEDIKVDVSDKKIYICVPNAEINDAYVVMDTLEISESNNIFNPLTDNDLKDELLKIKNKAIQEAEKKGIYQKAEKMLEQQIRESLQEFETEGYEIVYL